MVTPAKDPYAIPKARIYSACAWAAACVACATESAASYRVRQ
jgi:hypothetical protein